MKKTIELGRVLYGVSYISFRESISLCAETLREHYEVPRTARRIWVTVSDAPFEDADAWKIDTLFVAVTPLDPYYSRHVPLPGHTFAWLKRLLGRKRKFWVEVEYER